MEQQHQNSLKEALSIPITSFMRQVAKGIFKHTSNDELIQLHFQYHFNPSDLPGIQALGLSEELRPLDESATSYTLLIDLELERRGLVVGTDWKPINPHALIPL